MNPPSCSILQAACATIASPYSYDPVVVKENNDEMMYIGAMTGYANPANEMLKEAEKLFGKNAMVATIISIGSGKLIIGQNTNESGNMQLHDILRQAMSDTERVHNEMQGRFQDLGIYYRFNVDGAFPIHNNVGGATRLHTMAYLEEAATSQRMDGAVNSMQERKGLKPLKELSPVSSSYIIS
jgi:hypothetical protein